MDTELAMRLLLYFGRPAEIRNAQASELSQVGVPARALDYIRSPGVAHDERWLEEVGH